MTSLDAIDLRILNALQKNARMTTLELAERVGLSATPCARRVKRMEEEGIIRAYVAVVDPGRLGLGLTVFLNVRLRHQTKEAVDTFEDAVRSMPEITECHLVTGNHDYLLKLRVADVEAFKDFIRNRLIAIEGIGETQSSIVLGEIKSSDAR